MFSAFEWSMAARYLRARRREGFISVIAWFSLIGIALGVATLIIVMSVMNGFRTELLSRILGLNGHVVVQAYGLPIKDYDAIAERIRKQDGVIQVIPMIENQVMATAKGRAIGAVVRGITPEAFQQKKILAENLIAGDVKNFKAGRGVFIGTHMAANLGLRLGDKIVLVSPQGTVTPFGSVPRSKAYLVAGIFKVGMYEYDSSFAFLPLADAQIYFRMKQQVSAIEAFIDNVNDAGILRDAIREDLKAYRVVDWQQRNSHFFSALQVERNVMFLILTLIIVVAAFNIISSLIMLVKDKGKAIAILRTMGATRGMIMRIFIICGSAIGMIGTTIGFVLGLLFCLNIDSIRLFLEALLQTELWSVEIRFLSKIPAEVDSGEVISVVAIALVLSFLATLYPSWRAARLDPVEALRYE
jgi:lipoprotein-releasing system permease protein